MNDHVAKAADYRAKAAKESQAGSAASLDHVRAKHDRAARVWTGLAEAEDGREAERQRRLGIAAHRVAARGAPAEA